MKYNKTASQALEERRDVERFAHKFGAKIRESREYRHRVTIPMYVPYGHNDPIGYHDFNRNVYDVPYVEVHMPAESFEHLIQVDEVNSYDAHYVSQALDVLKQHREDEWVRDRNPAVQKAWRNYLMLLELARN